MKYILLKNKMNSYQLIKKVTQKDLDNLNHVNNIVYVQWIQEISKEHWQAVLKENTDDYVWVVRRHDITYYDAAKLNDQVEITTAITKTRGPISYREVVIKDLKTKKLLAKALTEWCLLDPLTFKPIRVPDTIKNLFNLS